MIRDLHEKIVSGQKTSVEITSECLKKAHKGQEEGGVHAYITIDDDVALAKAASVDQKVAAGESINVLAGVPGAIKDNILTKGVQATAGSKILGGYIPAYDATVIEKLREDDAVMLGKANMDEFACGSSTEHSAYGLTRNPHDLTRVPGGSSGGSAAAVAAGSAIWALGSDTGGSIRQPASFCGITGIKPTYGRVSRYGVIAYGSSLDQVGVLAHSAADAATVLTSIAGRDMKDATSAHSDGQDYERFLVGNITGAKIGIPKEFLGEGLQENVRQSYEAAIEKYKQLGAEIVEISLPHTDAALATYYVIALSELSSNLARYDGVRYGHIPEIEKCESMNDFYKQVRGAGFGDEIKKRLILGTYALSAGYSDAYYKKAQKVRALIRKDYEKAFAGVDYIFTPTVPEVAFEIGSHSEDPLTMYLADIYTVPVNLAGLPALSHPIGSVSVGGSELPVGGQLIGKWFDEEGILNAAHTYETATF